MADIFISYAREDRDKAEELAHALEERGWKVWWDREIPLGLAFDEVIERELLASRCVIALWTTSSLSSKWVRREARAAAKRDILVPILADDVEPPLEFVELQAANLAGWPPLHGHPEFEKVVERIEELVAAAGSAAAPAATKVPATPPRPRSTMPGRPSTRPPDRVDAGARGPMRGAIMIVLAAAIAAGAVYIAMRPTPSPETGRETGVSAPTTTSLPPADPKTSDAPSSRPRAAASPAAVPPAATRPPKTSSKASTETHRTDFELSIAQVDYFSSKEFEIASLDPAEDFSLTFNVKSTRPGGSTRYGIAWNFQPDDFMLFTLHSTNFGYYSIGPGRSRTYRPFTRFSEGPVDINAERDFDALQMSKSGDVLVFSINGREVWRTRDYRVLSNRFAFWAADTTDAVMSSYLVRR